MIPKMPRKLKRKNLVPSEARAAMSAGARKARAAQWGEKRAPSKKVTVDASVADLLAATIPEKERREFATRALSEALFEYL